MAQHMQHMLFEFKRNLFEQKKNTSLHGREAQSGQVRAYA